MVTVTGWTLDYIDGIEMPDIFALWKYWSDFPPVHLSLRVFLAASSGQSLRPRDSVMTEGSGLTAAESSLASQEATPFHQLPADVQQWLKQQGQQGKESANA